MKPLKPKIFVIFQYDDYSPDACKRLYSAVRPTQLFVLCETIEMYVDHACVHGVQGGVKRTPELDITGDTVPAYHHNKNKSRA